MIIVTGILKTCVGRSMSNYFPSLRSKITNMGKMDSIIKRIDAEFWPLLGGKAELELIMGARSFTVHKSIYGPYYNAGINIYASFYYRRSRGILRDSLPNFLEFKFFTPYDGNEPRDYTLLSSVTVCNTFGFHEATRGMSFARGQRRGVIKNITEDVLRKTIRDMTGYTIRPWG